MEFEFALKAAANLRTVGPFWYRGWLPVEWDLDSQIQFWRRQRSISRSPRWRAACATDRPDTRQPLARAHAGP